MKCFRLASQMSFLEDCRWVAKDNSFTCFGTVTSDHGKAIEVLIKKLCITNISNNNNSPSLESLVACSLIPLRKNSRSTPIGVGEVLRRISGKAVMMISKTRCYESSRLITSLCGTGSWC